MDGWAHFLTELSIWAVPTVFAIVLHELAHGVVARRLGDDTAERAGRLTLNPIPHIDPVGTIVLPAALLFLHLPVFGYARPVPVDFSKLRNGRRGMMEVAAAGPLTNFMIAVMSAFALRLVLPFADGRLGTALIRPLALMLGVSVVINVALAVFNLFPLLPLDGGRVVAGILPLRLAVGFARLEKYGFLILLVLLYNNSVQRVINPVINALVRMLL